MHEESISSVIMKNIASMKRTITLLAVLFLALGFAEAQNVYFAGQANDTAKVWKNNILTLSVSDSLNIHFDDMQVANDSTIFLAGHVFDTVFTQGRIWLNDSCIFAVDTNSVINRLLLEGQGWTAAGYTTNAMGYTNAAVWQNSNLVHSPNDSVNSFAYALAINGTDLYYAGSVMVDDTLGIDEAAVWKNDSLLWQYMNSSCIIDLCHDGTGLYAAGYCILEGLISAALWQNDSIIFSVGDLETNAMFSAMDIYDGSIYLAGYIDDSLTVWQDGEVLFSHPFTNFSEINALVVNEFGVYYAGLIDSVTTVWKDGEVLYQPEGCESITALAVLPPPPVTGFTLTVMVNDTLWGSVSGGGVYPEGDTATIEAFPNMGCEFLFWNDSITDNPRDIVVLGDTTFTACFGLIEYLIETAVMPEGSGTVTGGGIGHYGDTLTLEAVAYAGYDFVGWADSITDNPRNIVVTQDSLFTALFDLTQCLVATTVSPESAGVVTGGGTYAYGTAIQLEARAFEGHDFLQWGDGGTDNPREIVVESDTVFIAEFSTYQYEITTEAAPENGGMVTGSGTYGHGSIATLTAVPNEGFSFVCWHDGIMSNPRHITVTQDSHFKALFGQNTVPHYTINAVSADTTLGTVRGGGTYEEGSVAEITARPKDHAYFKQWDDGSTDNPRSITVTHDVTVTAYFEAKPTYTIRVGANDSAMGSVYGGGVFHEGETTTIGATPNEGYHFTGWHDGVMSNPRIIEVVENALFTAFFAATPVNAYSVVVTCDESQGFIICPSGPFAEGSIITIAAINADGYRFKQWSDGNTNNPRRLVVDHDITLTALFESVGIDESQTTHLRIFPNPASDAVRIEGMEGKLKIFNANGLLVKSLHINGDTTLSLAGLPAGVYFIGTGGRFAKLIKK